MIVLDQLALAGIAVALVVVALVVLVGLWPCIRTHGGKRRHGD
jgi:hypothetical protein